MDYQSADQQLTGRNKDSRKIANNTYLQRRGAGIVVKLHNTDIIGYRSDGEIVLDSGGWLTVTTKARMNEFLSGYYIRQERGQWYLEDMTRRMDVCLYQDGLTILPDGTVTGGKPLDAGKAALKIRKQAQNYGRRIDTDGDDVCIYVNRERDGFPCGEMACTSHDSLSPIREKITDNKVFSGPPSASQGK